MEELSKKVKFLRERANLTQKELAEKLKISEKTVFRAEAGKTIDIENTKRFSKYFAVPADYLLGLNSFIQDEEVKNKVMEYGNLYQTLLELRNRESIIEGRQYYQIVMDKNGIGGITEWVGFSSDGKDIKRLRIIEPYNSFDMCEKVYDIPMIINTYDELQLYYKHQGWALIDKELCDKKFPHLVFIYGR